MRKISFEPQPARLASDLEILRGKALAGGAAEASIVDVAQVVFDPGVKKRAESSAGYRSYHWPLSYPKDSIEEAVAAYRKGILFRMAADGKIPEYSGGPIPDPTHRDLYSKVYEITAAVESASFYHGYHLAMGFAAGNCRGILCAREPGCQAMTRGRACLHPYRARPSMEAAGMNAREMARNLGWGDVPADEEGFPAGLVLVF